MTYREYMDHLKVCEVLGKEPAGKFKVIHDHLTGIWDDMEVVVDSRTNNIFFQNEEGWYFKQGQEKEWLSCHYDRVWLFFYTVMGRSETRNFIKSAVEHQYNCKVGTPTDYHPLNGLPVKQPPMCEVGTPVHMHMDRTQEEQHDLSRIHDPHEGVRLYGNSPERTVQEDT